jgi:hypothetical protein
MSYLRTFSPALVLLALLVCIAPLIQTPQPATLPTAIDTSSLAAFYVAPGGDDANPGTESQPWASIQHAADVLQAGDTVYVRAGTYAEDVEIHVSGSEMEGYIYFRNYPGETPVLDGSGLTVPTSNAGLFYIENQSYLIIRGFELRNYQSSTPDIVPTGVHLRGNSHHIQILDNHIHDIASNAAVNGDLLGRDAHGIAVYGDDSPGGIHDLLIEGNELDHLTLGSSEALVLNGNVYDFIVRGNLCTITITSASTPSALRKSLPIRPPIRLGEASSVTTWSTTSTITTTRRMGASVVRMAFMWMEAHISPWNVTACITATSAWRSPASTSFTSPVSSPSPIT